MSSMKSFSLTKDQMKQWSADKEREAKSASVGPSFLAQMNAAAAAGLGAASTVAAPTPTSAGGQPPRTPSKQQPASGRLGSNRSAANSKSKTLPRGFSLDKLQAAVASGAAGPAPTGSTGSTASTAPASPFSAFKSKPSGAGAGGFTPAAALISGAGGSGFEDFDDAGFGSDDEPDWDGARTSTGSGSGPVNVPPSSFSAAAVALSKTQPQIMSALAQFKSNGNTPPALLNGGSGGGGGGSNLGSLTQPLSAEFKTRHLPAATSALLAQGGVTTPTAASGLSKPIGSGGRSLLPGTEPAKVDVNTLCDNFLNV